MIRSKHQFYLEMFRHNNGILRYSEAINLGIPRYYLEQLTKTGNLVKETTGLYRLDEPDPSSHPDLVRVSILVPRSVVCLISALNFYELTTIIPQKVNIALPQGITNPKIHYPPIRVFHFSEKSFNAGIEEQYIDGIKVKIYSREKTIADCFKFRKQIGTSTAVEALRDYMQQPSSNIRSLITNAKIDRVENVMRPYLETFL